MGMPCTRRHRQRAVAAAPPLWRGRPCWVRPPRRSSPLPPPSSSAWCDLAAAAAKTTATVALVAAPVMSLATSWVHPAALPKWLLRALDLHSVPACGARLPPRHHLRLAVYLSPLPPSGAAPTPPPPAVLLPYGNPRVQLVATPTICRLPLAR